MASLADEFDEGGDEFDSAFGESLTLNDNASASYVVTGNVSEFLVSRELTERNTFRTLRSARVVINKSTHAALTSALAASEFSAIPSGWRVTYGGMNYRVSNPMSDAVSLSFDIEQTIS